MDFVAPRGTDTLVMLVTYLPPVNRETMNAAIDGARKVIDIETNRYG